MTHRVLIVDDDPAQRRLLDSMIRRCGHDTVLADSGGSALDLLAQPRTRPVDLIVLDLVMPGMDGLEMLSRLDTTGGRIPVIVQTAQGSIETVVKAMRAGADDFVVKPVSPERLKVSMQNLLRVNALTEEVKRLNQKAGGHLTFADLIAAAPAHAAMLRGWCGAAPSRASPF